MKQAINLTISGIRNIANFLSIKTRDDMSINELLKRHKRLMLTYNDMSTKERNSSDGKSLMIEANQIATKLKGYKEYYLGHSSAMKE